MKKTIKRVQSENRFSTLSSVSFLRVAKTKYFAFAAAAFILASCSNDEDFSPQDNLKDTPITVTAGVAELTTRAGYVGTTVLPDKFYLSIDQVNDDYDYTNVLMKNVSGAWKGYESDETTEKTLLWGNSTDYISVTAATFSLDGAQTLMAEADQSTAEGVKKSDHLLMATDNAVMPSSAGISVEFQHIMSKVDMTITLGDEFNETDNPITGVKFMGTVASNSYTVGSGWETIATDATATDITPFQTSYTPIDAEKGIANAVAEYEAIFVPQTIAAGDFIVAFSVGDRVFKWASADAVTLESGKRYTLALKAGKDKVSGATFTASAWNAGDSYADETD